MLITLDLGGDNMGFGLIRLFLYLSLTRQFREEPAVAVAAERAADDAFDEDLDVPLSSKVLTES